MERYEVDGEMQWKKMKQIVNDTIGEGVWEISDCNTYNDKPKINLYDSDDEIMARIEIPSLEEKDIKVVYHNGILEVTMKKKLVTLSNR